VLGREGRNVVAYPAAGQTQVVSTSPRGGIPSGTVACPCRYIHGPAAITTVGDMENTVRLIQAFVKRISG